MPRYICTMRPKNPCLPSRRDALATLTAASAMLALMPGGCASPFRALSFLHGVASGDPLQDRVILWTRAQPEDGQPVTLVWEIAKDKEFGHIISAGEVTVSAEHDFIAKVDAGGLAPAHTYFYRFRSDNHVSPVGQTRTLPAGEVSSFRLACVSCSHYAAGYFNVYRAIAMRDDIELVLHLGDYIYEYGQENYGGEAGKKTGRLLVPEHETVSLEDYRARYGLYRLDEDLQALHAAKPMVAVWDDHETANNAWKAGAQNHNAEDGEGPYEARAAVSLQAYLEWLPIREHLSEKERIFRSFTIGDLGRLVVLDTRRYGRDRQLDYRQDYTPQQWPYDISDPQNPEPLEADEKLSTGTIAYYDIPFDIRETPPRPITDREYIASLDRKALPEGIAYLPDWKRFEQEKLRDPARSLMGKTQEAWLEEELRDSRKAGQTWQIVAQQLLVGRTPATDLSSLLDWSKVPERIRASLKRLGTLARAGLPLNLDAWDGYPAARERLYTTFLEQGVNPLVLAGDTHNAWAFNLQTGHHVPVGVEIACPSVTSPGLESFLPGDPEKIAAALIKASPDLVWAETSHRGYVTLNLTREAATADWFLVDTVSSRHFDVKHMMRFYSQAGSRVLTPSV